VLRRLAWAVPTLLFITFLVYIALRTGTDPVASYKRVNARATPAKIQQYIDANGLDPNYVRGYFPGLATFSPLIGRAVSKAHAKCGLH